MQFCEFKYILKKDIMQFVVELISLTHSFQLFPGILNVLLGTTTILEML